MNLTPTGFGIIVLLLIVVAVIIVAAENIRDRREDTQDILDLKQDILDYHCAGHGHKYVAVDWHWLCSHCGDIVRQPLNCGGLHRYIETRQSLLCTVCGHRTALPYDQQKDAS